MCSLVSGWFGLPWLLCLGAAWSGNGACLISIACHVRTLFNTVQQRLWSICSWLLQSFCQNHSKLVYSFACSFFPPIFSFSAFLFYFKRSWILSCDPPVRCPFPLLGSLHVLFSLNKTHLLQYGRRNCIEVVPSLSSCSPLPIRASQSIEM